MPVSFTGPGNSDPATHFGIFIHELQPTEADLLAAGQYLRGQIRDRTFRGQSVDGTPFFWYSPAYEKKKGQTNVDLYSRGASKHMLDALTVQASTEPLQISIGIFGDAEVAMRAKVHNEGATIRTRLGTGKHKDIGASRRFGTEIRRQKKRGVASFSMPKREFLGATEEDIMNMRRIIVRSIQQRTGSTVAA